MLLEVRTKIDYTSDITLFLICLIPNYCLYGTCKLLRDYDWWEEIRNWSWLTLCGTALFHSCTVQSNGVTGKNKYKIICIVKTSSIPLCNFLMTWTICSEHLQWWHESLFVIDSSIRKLVVVCRSTCAHSRKRGWTDNWLIVLVW